jgi:hypothetical protein
LASADATDYTYLTLPPDRALRSCIGLVVAGLAARAKVGVAAIEEAVVLLESQQATNGLTRYRFSLKDDSLLAEVEEWEPAAIPGDSEPGWRTVVELVS